MSKPKSAPHTQTHTGMHLAPMRADHADFERTIGFLISIGIKAEIKPEANGFIRKVRLEQGALHIQPDAPISGILHEAGHIAVLPSAFRHLATGNISSAQRAALEATQDLDPDSAPYRAAMQCSDPETTAWAWAAGEHLGLAPEVIIQDNEYANSGAEMRAACQARAYIGINGLSHAGFCANRAGPYATAKGLPAYPSLMMWLQH